MGHTTDLQIISKQLRAILVRYAPPFHIRMLTPTAIDLWAEGEFEVMGRPRHEVFFASAIIQSDYVGFYYMPVYTDVESIKKTIPPRLRAMLKGKSCFHITEWDDALAHDVRTALKHGAAIYRAHGWV
jgi:hypothetical protein